MTEEEKSRMLDLQEKIRILENENESLAAQVEETLLLSLVSESMATHNEIQPLLDHSLERIAVIKNIPWCACCELKNSRAIPVSTFLLKRDELSTSKIISLDDRILQQIINGQRVFNLSRDSGFWMSLHFPGSSIDFHSALVFPYQSRFIPNGLFIFAWDEAGYNPSELESILFRLIEIITERIDKILLLKEIQDLNLQLEKKVLERTRELSMSNRKLRKEISGRKKMEKDLLAAKEKAEESDRLKTAFLANMSHEIRTPMNAILGFVSLLSNQDLTPEDQEKYIQIVQKSGDFLLRLIDDILDLSMLESGQMRIIPSEFRPSDTLRELYVQFSRHDQLLEKNELKLELQSGVPDDFRIISDPHRVRQIMINLLDNALKFTDRGKILFGCEFIRKGELEKDLLRFFVKDSGIGIDPSQQSKVFKRFWKADARPEMLYRGVGLGLPVSYELSEKLGGVMHFESVPGAGSTFFFDLPF